MTVPKVAPRILLAVASFAALAVVPDWPHRHLDDPSYWGLLGYLIVFAMLLVRPRASWGIGGSARGIIRLFLLGLPLVYVADWLRFGGSSLEFVAEVAGLGIWVVLAVLAGRSDIALWSGCVGHAAWDALHFGRVGFVPDWYVAACLAVDIGLGAFVLLNLRHAHASSHGLEPRPGGT